MLFKEEKAPGNYEMKFNGSNLSSGVYFCCLHTGNYGKIKKLMNFFPIISSICLLYFPNTIKIILPYTSFDYI